MPIRNLVFPHRTHGRAFSHVRQIASGSSRGSRAKFPHFGHIRLLNSRL